MQILFTGASSFTGFWFVKALHQAGHKVWAILRKQPKEYEGIRKKRVEMLLNYCEPIYQVEFGSEKMLHLFKEHSFSLLAHHAADVTNYKSPDFDCVQALANNTHNLVPLLTTMKQHGCNHLLLTGSIFEQREGAGKEELPAVSPYGLSKGLTSDLFRFYTAREEIKLAKFIIPNPFGPFEELRFTTYIVQQWMKGKVARCDYPNFVRDNIHVSLLAKAYAQYADDFVKGKAAPKKAPCGYPESQGAFTKRFAKEISARLAIPCPVEMPENHPFPEPEVRINTDVLDKSLLRWKESDAWDELADYYRSYL